MNPIGTAPAQSSNVEYDVIDEPVEVFCEDQGKTLPEADCQQCGKIWLSKAFLKFLRESFEELQFALSRLETQVDSVFLEGSFDPKKVALAVGNIRFEVNCIQELFRKIDILPEKKK